MATPVVNLSTSELTLSQYIGHDIGEIQAGYAALIANVEANENLSVTERAALLVKTEANKNDLTALQNQIASIPAQVSEIDDESTATDKTWSASFIGASISNATAAVKQSIMGAVGADSDTLEELVAFIEANGDAIAGLSASFVSFTSDQTLTDVQTAQARTNIAAASQSAVSALEAFMAKIGDPLVNLVDAYETERQEAGGPVIARA